jgi:hypothetical protein
MSTTPPDELAALDESLLVRARAAVADKRARGIYTPEFVAMLEEPLDIRPDPAFAAGPSWEEAVRTVPVSANAPIVSTRPVIGPLLRALKALVRRSLHWYLAPVTAQVTAHNQAVVEVLAEHSREIVALRREVELLRRRVAALDAGDARDADTRPAPAPPA